MSNNKFPEWEDGVIRVNDSFDDINSVYEKYMSEAFEYNNEAVKMVEEFDEIKQNLFNLIRKLASLVVDKKRLCIGERFTVRDGDVYRYSSPRKLSKRRMLNNSILAREIRNHAKSKKYGKKFAEAFNLARFVNYLREESNFYAITQLESFSLDDSYCNEKPADENKDKYHLIYEPEKSSNNKISVLYEYNESILERLRHYNSAKSYSPGKKRNLNREPEKKRSNYISQIKHSNGVEKIVKKSHKKLKNSLEIIKNILNHVKDMFSRLLVSNSI